MWRHLRTFASGRPWAFEPSWRCGGFLFVNFFLECQSHSCFFCVNWIPSTEAQWFRIVSGRGSVVGRTGGRRNINQASSGFETRLAV